MTDQSIQNLRQAAQRIREAIKRTRSTAVSGPLYSALGYMGRVCDVNPPPPEEFAVAKVLAKSKNKTFGDMMDAIYHAAREKEDEKSV